LIYDIVRTGSCFPRDTRQRAALFLSLFAIFTVLDAPGCSSDDAAARRKLFDSCSLNSDCVSGLICALGKCRNQCVSSVDCAGGTCVTDGKNAVCLSAAEENKPCARVSDCPSPLACAADYRCRNLCASDADCDVLGVIGRACAKDAQGVDYCADVSEVRAGAIASQPPPGAPSTPVVEPAFDAGLESGAVELPIGSNGGTFGVDGVSVTIPPGALDHDITLSITPIAAPIAGSIGQAFEIGPTGTQFMQPALITFGYTDAELNGSPPSAFAVDTVVGGAWEPVSPPIVDPFTHTIAGTTMHLSPYALATSQGAVNAADASSSTSDGSASASAPCSAQTTLPLAVKLTLPVQWPATVSYAAGNGSATVWLLSNLTGNAALTGTFQTCGVTLPDLTYQGADTAIRGDLVSFVLPGAQTTTFPVTGMQSGWSPGDTFSTAAVTSLLGLSTNSTYRQTTVAWPATCATNCTPAGAFLPNDLVDDDGDGNPGVTAQPSTGGTNPTYTAPPSAQGNGAPLATQVDMVLRNAFALSGMRVTDCAQISGTASVQRFDTHVVGCVTQAGACASAQVAFLDQSRPVYTTPITGTFRAAQVSAQATCATVLTALP
jgi:hypothetical protein